jgi:hypothetical protein
VRIPDHAEIEKKLHSLFWDKKFKNEWFILGHEDVAMIKEILLRLAIDP